MTVWLYQSKICNQDFVLCKGALMERLVQVCYDMSISKTEKREGFRPAKAYKLRCKSIGIAVQKRLCCSTKLYVSQFLAYMP